MLKNIIFSKNIGFLLFLSFFIFYLKDYDYHNKYMFSSTIFAGIVSLVSYIFIRLVTHLLKLRDRAYYELIDLVLAVFLLCIFGLLTYWLSLILIILISIFFVICRKLLLRKISLFFVLSLSFFVFYVNENLSKLQLIGITNPTIYEILKSESRYFSYKSQNLFFYKITLPFSEKTRDIIKAKNCLMFLENKGANNKLKFLISEELQDSGKVLINNAEAFPEKNWRCDMRENFSIYNKKKIDVFFFMFYGV